ncbi:MAG: RHS repeat-associated core domain-containing protein [Acidobacteriota bacterium]
MLDSRTHNAVHEVTARNNSPLNYDLKGNLTGNNNGQVYAFDHENRMQSATIPATPDPLVAQYTYDATGRRVSKNFGGLTTIYVSAGLQEIAEYENGAASASPLRSYVFGSYIDEPVMMVVGTEKYFYHSNNLYSVAAITNAAGAVVERYRYDPYGKVTILAPDGTERTESAIGNPWTFTGRRLDAETGLYYFRARYYSAELGRFIGRDPLGYVDGMGLYGNYFSPNGMDPLGLGDPTLIESLIVTAIVVLGDRAKQTGEGLLQGLTNLGNAITNLPFNAVNSITPTITLGTYLVGPDGPVVIPPRRMEGPLIDMKNFDWSNNLVFREGDDYHRASVFLHEFGTEILIPEGWGRYGKFRWRKCCPDETPSILRQSGGTGGEGLSADDAYEAIRKSTTDVGEIAASTDLKKSNIQKIKDHLFNDGHLLDRYSDLGEPARYGRFDSDASIAQSWERLRTGNFTQADINLLKHEMAERWHMKKYGSGYNEAHKEAQRRFPSPLENERKCLK